MVSVFCFFSKTDTLNVCFSQKRVSPEFYIKFGTIHMPRQKQGLVLAANMTYARAILLVILHFVNRYHTPKTKQYLYNRGARRCQPYMKQRYRPDPAHEKGDRNSHAKRVDNALRRIKRKETMTLTICAKTVAIAAPAVPR